MLVLRRFLLLAVLCCAALPASAAAATVPGPRLAYVEWRPAPPMARLVTVAADGSDRRSLVPTGVQPLPEGDPAWSVDGSTLFFAGYRASATGEARENARTWIYAVGAEGGPARRLPGTAGARGPVLSPDGSTIAFERVRIRNRYDPRRPLKSGVSIRSSAWSVPVEGALPRQLTPWRWGLTVRPATYSPDGSTLLLERDRGGAFNPEVIAREAGRRSLRVLVTGAEQPAYSPDGTRIALVSYRDRDLARGPTGLEPVGELYVLDADGTRPRRLTRTPGQHESQPAWSPDGSRLAFLRARGPAGLGLGSTLLQANGDGTCLRSVAGAGGRRGPVLHGPAWQPGPVRAAGPLSC